MRATVRFALAACLLSISTIVLADPILGTADGLSSYTGKTTISFEGPFVNNMSITNQIAGVTFSGFKWNNSDLGQVGSHGFSGGYLVNGFPITTLSMSIVFDTPVIAADFAALDQGGLYSIAAYLGPTTGTPVDSMTLTIPSNPGSGYIGFANKPFDTITITSLDTISKPPLAFFMDSLEYVTYTQPDPPPAPAPVPEPASLVLFGSGLICVLRSLQRNSGRR